MQNPVRSFLTGIFLRPLFSPVIARAVLPPVAIRSPNKKFFLLAILTNISYNISAI